jgi:hypothetical protein
MADRWNITLFFSNSNIFPKGEYQKRLDETMRLAEIIHVPLIEDTYNHEEWLRAVSSADPGSPLREEPEGGKRCSKCFGYSLHRTGKAARNRGIPHITTTLTVSPHKSSSQIFAVAKGYPEFEYYDFKKMGGFQRSTVLSKKYFLYRQQYCGCEFSME